MSKERELEQSSFLESKTLSPEEQNAMPIGLHARQELVQQDELARGIHHRFHIVRVWILRPDLRLHSSEKEGVIAALLQLHDDVGQRGLLAAFEPPVQLGVVALQSGLSSNNLQ